MTFVIAFDFPRSLPTQRRKLNRLLHRIGAEKVQDSFWKCNDLKALTKIPLFIKSWGGKAEILEEKFLF
jgi:CRISPR/Cas system-associated endoribonuclease Cas2